LTLCALGVPLGMVRAADATAPVDYTQRNAPFAPAGSIEAVRRSPADERSPQQERRFDKPTVEKRAAPQADRKAGIAVGETTEKQVREKDSRRPQATAHRTSAFDAKEGPVSTADQTRPPPPLVAKYNDSMIAASAANMARFPAVDRSTTAKLNRFVFRKNPAEPGALTDGAPVVPAAGGSPSSK